MLLLLAQFLWLIWRRCVDIAPLCILPLSSDLFWELWTQPFKGPVRSLGRLGPRGTR